VVSNRVELNVKAKNNEGLWKNENILWLSYPKDNDCIIFLGKSLCNLSHTDSDPSNYHLYQGAEKCRGGKGDRKTVKPYLSYNMLNSGDIKKRIMCKQVKILQIWTCAQQSFLALSTTTCLNTGYSLHPHILFTSKTLIPLNYT